MSIELVGMSEDAEITGLSWHEYHDGDVDHLGVYNLAIRCEQGARSPVWDTVMAGTLIFQNVPLYVKEDVRGDYYEGAKWGFKIGDGAELLIIDRCPRGEDPIHGVPTRYYEHWGYFTSIMESYITYNDISGGNRTGFQDLTPGLPGYTWPTGPKLCEGNVCHDYGWDWDVANGGSAITYWESRGPLVIRNNEVTNARYGCMAIAHQPPDKNPFTVSREGHTHEQVWVEGNVFTSPDSQRSNAAISSAVQVTVRENELQGNNWDLTIDGATPAKWGAPPCKDVVIHGDHDIMSWNGDMYVPWGLRGV